ncbi:MAG: acyl-CoA dehydrogenase family protein [Fusobacteriaceae bacterium]
MAIMLSKEEQDLYEKALNYGINSLDPVALEVDKSPELARKIFLDMAENGFCGLGIPTELGGKGYNYLQSALVYEGLAYGDGMMSFAMQLHNNISMEIATFYEGISENVKAIVPDLASGKKTTAFALTESVSGCDPAATSTYAELREDGYHIFGKKDWIANGKDADYYNVMVKDGKDSKNMIMLLVEKGTKGLRFLENRERLIGNGFSCGGLEFDDCIISKENLLSNNGFKEALIAIDVARIFTPAIAVGIAQKAVDITAEHLANRSSFGNPIIKNQGIQWELADLSSKIEAARWLVYRTASVMDQGGPVASVAAKNKYFGTEVAMETTVKCAQLFGAEGFMKDSKISKLLYIAKMLQIVDGTTEIQKIVIGRDISRKFLKKI